MRIMQNTIEAVLNSVIIQEVVGDYVDLQKKGANWVGFCPFHNEKTSSFVVSPVKGIFKCFGCGESGNSLGFLMKQQNLTFPEAIIKLAGKYNIAVEYEDYDDKQKENIERSEHIKRVMQVAQQEYFIKNRVEQDFKEYCESRGLTEEDILDWGLGFAKYDFKGLVNIFLQRGDFGYAEDGGICHSKEEKCYDTLINRITIPIKSREGTIIGFAGRTVEDDKKQAKYLNPKETPVYNKSRVVFGIDRAAKFIAEQNEVILTEGYFDVIGCHKIGLCNAVASCGTALTEGMLRALSRFTNNFLIMYDGDSAGKKATMAAIELLLKNNLYVNVVSLEDGKDPFDFSNDYKGENVREDLSKITKHGILWAYDYLFVDIKLTDLEAMERAIARLCELLSLLPDFSRDYFIKIISAKKLVGAATLKKRLNIPKHIKSVNVNGEAKLVDEEDEFEKYGFFQYKGMYWGMTNNGGKYPVSNFTMEILFHVKTGGEEAFRLIKIKNIHGYEAIINMNTDDFVGLNSFRKLIARRGNYLWKGKEEDLTKLQDKLQREERPTELVDILGYNPRGNFYAFANGLIDMDNLESQAVFKDIDEYGIVSHKDKNYFIPAMSIIYADKEDLFYNYKKFVYKKRNLALATWYRLFEDVYGDNARLGFVFYVASLFSDMIYKKMARRFPILSLYGQRGAGKGTFAESLLCLFGEPQEQIMLGGNTTNVGFMRSFAQYRNGIVWLDEYKNNLHKKVIEAIKNIYDRIGYKRGKKDHSFEVEYVPVTSAAILSGQDMPTIEPALFTRVIMLTFKETKHNDESRVKYRKLVLEQDAGLSHLTVYLLQYGNYIEENFKETYENEVKLIFAEVQKYQVEERMISNYACMSTVCKLLLDKEKLGFAHHSFRSMLVNNMLSQHAVLEGSDDTTVFWQIVESMFNQNVIKEGVDFELEDKKLYIRLQQVIGLYQIEMTRRNNPNYLQKSTLENYLEIDKNKYLGKYKKQFKNGSYTWCMVFNYASLDINLIRRDTDESFESVNARYREMGVEVRGENSLAEVGSDNIEVLPF